MYLTEMMLLSNSLKVLKSWTIVELIENLIEKLAKTPTFYKKIVNALSSDQGF